MLDLTSLEIRTIEKNNYIQFCACDETYLETEANREKNSKMTGRYIDITLKRLVSKINVEFSQHFSRSGRIISKYIQMSTGRKKKKKSSFISLSVAVALHSYIFIELLELNFTYLFMRFNLLILYAIYRISVTVL